MGIFARKKPPTALTALVNRIMENESGASDLDSVDVLDVIEQLQGGRAEPAREVARAVRRKLKHGRRSERQRALLLVEVLVDNGGRALSKLPMLEDLCDYMIQASDGDGDERVSRQSRYIVRAWSLRDDALGCFVREHPDFRSKTRNRSQSYPHAAPRPDSDAARPRSARSVSRSPSPINLREGSIATMISTAHSVATRLANSVIIHKEDVRASAEAAGYHRQAKGLRRQVLRLIQDDAPAVQEYIQELLTVNDELVSAVLSYDGAAAPHRDRAGSDDDAASGPSPAAPQASPNPFDDSYEFDGVPQHRPMW